jgi:outer membrane protein OmpA-like peptidoglycan-associated protein/tetratricopeptide (TPR) repeat protein
MNKISALVFLLLTANLSRAQFTETEVRNMANQASEQELVIQCSRYLQENFYHFAEIITNRLLELDPDNANYHYRKGFIVLGMRTDHEAAIKYLSKATKKIQKNYDMYSKAEDAVPADVFFHLGRAYHLNEQFDKAVENYKRFLVETDKRSELIKDAEKRIIQCDVAKKLMAAPQDVKIKNLGTKINTEYADFSSTISIDGRALYYTSRRPWENGESNNFRDPMLNHFSEDIYQSTLSPFYEWNQPQRMNMCKPEFNEATVSVSIDERRVYTYNDKSGMGDIYYSQLLDGKFGPVTPVDVTDVNTQKRWETHYMVSPDGNMRFFVSDKENGTGRRDIYFSENIDGTWTNPANMSNINTEWDEDSPFMGLDNNTLYFSSNGPNSMGEFDIFMTVRDENGMWGDPVNIGYPINSVGDDIFYTHTADGKKAYFTSFRKGGFGEKDVYEIALNNSSVRNIAFLNGQIIHSKGKTIPEDSYVTIKCINCADQNEKQIFARISDGFFGSKLMKCKEYELAYYYNNGTKNPYRERFTTNCDLAYEEIIKKVLLDDDNKVIIPFFTYDVIAAVSDRDSKKAIQGAKIEFKNNKDNLNYTTTSNGESKTELGKNKTFGDVLNYTVTVSAPGYLTQSIEMSDTLGADSILRKEFALIQDTSGKDLGPFLILYNFDKYDIRPDAVVILNKIVKVMNDNPSLKIELGSHTDSRGNDAYNKKLSDNRAKSARDYIAKRISDPKRILYKGYGETKLKNKCDDGVKCTPAEHQENRRTEFIIIK